MSTSGTAQTTAAGVTSAGTTTTTTATTGSGSVLASSTSTSTTTTATASRSGSKKQFCSQLEADTVALLQRAEAVVVATMDEVVSDTATQQDMIHEQAQLILLQQELDGWSISSLTPSKRAYYQTELHTRRTAIETVLSLIQVKLRKWGPPTTTARVSTSTMMAPPSLPTTAAAPLRPPSSATTTGMSAPVTIPSSGQTSVATTVWSAAAAPQMSSWQPPGAGTGPPSTVSSNAQSVPSWMSQPHNPFAPNQCVLGPDYYLSFPPPWNALPQASSASVGDLLKVAPHALPRFGGERAAYLAWRSAFIPCVHLTHVDLSFKVMLLRSCMLPDTQRMREFIRSILCTPEGYREAVRKLESRYGGEENRLLTRHEALLSLPVLKEGDFKTLEALESRLLTYLMEWGQLNAGDAESLSLFTSIMAKIDKRFGRKYVNWVEDRGRVRGLKSLHVWLKEQLEIHRTVEQYYGQTQVDPSNPIDREGARSFRPMPQSCNDKNYKRDNAFLLQEEEAESQQPVVETAAVQSASAPMAEQQGNNRLRSFCPTARPHISLVIATNSRP